jgi:hypothetical protein
MSKRVSSSIDVQVNPPGSDEPCGIGQAPVAGCRMWSTTARNVHGDCRMMSPPVWSSPSSCVGNRCAQILGCTLCESTTLSLSPAIRNVAFQSLGFVASGLKTMLAGSEPNVRHKRHAADRPRHRTRVEIRRRKPCVEQHAGAPGRDYRTGDHLKYVLISCATFPNQRP